jgi:hypothetical protein
MIHDLIILEVGFQTIENPIILFHSYISLQRSFELCNFHMECMRETFFSTTNLFNAKVSNPTSNVFLSTCVLV